MASSRIGKTVLSLAVAGAFAGGVSHARASGFALIEESASGLGTSFAGAAAAAEDASTIFYNPAGMSLLPGMQVSAGLDFINLSAKFSDSASTAAGGRPLGGNGGDAGGLATVPNVYFAMDVAPDWKVGVGLSVPFGLKTEYTSDWVGRFQAIKSDISTFNLNPSASYKVNDKVSLGFGLDYQTIDAEFTNAINLGGVAEEIADIKAKDNTGWGYNLGVMYQLAPDTRLGVSYRSSIKYHLTGTATFSAGQPVPSVNVSSDITMPDSASIALQHRLNPGWTLLADITRTGWSKIKDLTIMNDTAGSTLSSTPENFRNTWRVGVGAVHRYDDAWSIKMGLAYDQTPVNDTDRTARLPDNNRLWLSAGGQYRLSKTGTLDFGYAHLFIKDAPINQTNPATAGGGQLVGTYKGSVDILGVQLAHRF
ncbi:MAG TPA: outer membrane protein transport protein [Burkholderiales bacterium]|nr:outer membrane protein transport protein [Burkholderiales bacterium]